MVATDAHGAAKRRPCMRAAFERISFRLGERTARLACIENPRRVLEGRGLETLESAGTRALRKDGVSRDR